MDSIEDGFEHATRVLGDRFLHAAYQHVYQEMIKAGDVRWLENQVSVELGSTGGFLKELIPDLITSDVRPGPDVLLLVDAGRLPFGDKSVSNFFLKDTLHHIPDVSAFLDDAARCLRPGGKVICVEPYWGLMAKILYRYFHPESFDQKTLNWTFDSSGPMSSNQALLWILLRRDRRRFAVRHPEFEVHEFGPLLGPSYVFAGGARRPALLPYSFVSRMFEIEKKSKWWRRHFALAYLCVLERRT